MDVGQERRCSPQQQQQQQQKQQQSSRQDNDNEEDEGHRVSVGVGPEVAMAMEVDDACGAPPNVAGKQRRTGEAATAGKQIEGSVTARAESNNNNNNLGNASAIGSGTMATAASAASTVGSSHVQEQIPAIVNRYVMHGKIDRGTFSTVTLATRRDEQHLPMDARRLYAIKLITQTSHPTRIEREIRCMMEIGGRAQNVVEIVDGFRYQGSVGLVMNYIPHEPFHVYYTQLSPAEVQRYVRELLVALAHVHRYGVIHRDVKPSNFLHSRRNGGTFVLVDFGLAQELRAGELTAKAPGDSGRGGSKRPDPVGTTGGSISEPTAATVKRHRAAAPAAEQVVFRNPLKQPGPPPGTTNYTISPLKVSNNTLKDLVESPLARQIKSAAIGIGNGLKSRRSVAGCASPQGGGSERENKRSTKDLDEATQVKLTAAGVGAGLRTHRSTAAAAAATVPPSSAAANASAPPAARQSSDLPWCECYGKPQVCNRCLVKRELHAPRAGTPGYRPPEVLLKFPDQTTAVDMWAAGVIFLSLLAKCYPFFGNTDDMTSLAQIISVFGYERMLETARSLDRTLLVSEDTMRMRALSLRRICQHFRALVRQRETSAGGTATTTAAGTGTAAPSAPSGSSSPPPAPDDAGNMDDSCDNCMQPPERCLCEQRRRRLGKAQPDDSPVVPPEPDDCDEYGSAAYDLLERLLETDPHRRISAADALQHPYFEVQY